MAEAPGAVDAFKDALNGKLKKYKGGWAADYITGNGSKNIPLLKIAADAVLADQRNDLGMLLKIAQAVRGYLAHAQKSGAFHGEEFSTIYSRWILVPLIAIWNVLNKNDLDVAKELHLFLRSVTSLAALSAGHGRSFHHHKGTKWVDATPYTIFGGSRSWVRGKGDDNKRGNDDSIVWHDADSACELIDLLLNIEQFDKSGNHFVWDTMNSLRKRYNTWNPLTSGEQAVIRKLVIFTGSKQDVESVLEYVREYPVHPSQGEIIFLRDASGNAATVYTDGYNYGSTSFMQLKDFSFETKRFFTLGVANPNKRSNAEDSKAIVYDADDLWYAEVTAEDRTIFDLDSNKEVKTPNIRVPLSVHSADWLYRVSIGRGFVGVLYPDSVQEPDDDDTSSTPPPAGDHKLDQVVEFIYEWLRESGLLEELKKRLVRKALKELGL
jgi:hypothetical protein